MAETVVRRQNEFLVVFGEKDFAPDYVCALQAAGTPQTLVDHVRPLRTPFGSTILVVTVSSTWKKADTYRLREWLFSVLQRAGYRGDMKSVMAPNPARRFRA